MSGSVSIDKEWTIPQVRSVCCDAPVLYGQLAIGSQSGDICAWCRDHCGVVAVVVCAACGEWVDEGEAQPTKSGVLCIPCAERRYPVLDHGDSIFPY